MSNVSNEKRIASASRVSKSSSQTIFKAFVDPDALVSWLPPKDMNGHISEFDVRDGGAYQI
ncbi:hypothetical protein [Paenibacillus paridis]|uniref:hypothetical protein n=1 Tax=Paenibacillus paridis TaxID=2583376 RepID=UPI001EE486C5|nr:hypothetical protein [Paenibacillus paridis]